MKTNLAKQQATIEACHGMELLAGFINWIKEDGMQAVVTATGKHTRELGRYQKVFKVLAHPSVQHAAEDARLSFTTVINLGKAAYPLRKRKDRNPLLIELCQQLAGLNADASLALIRDMVAAWLGDTSQRRDVACMHKNVGKDGKRRFTAALSAPVAARVDAVLHVLTEKIRQTEPELQYDEAYAKAFTQKLLSKANDDGDAAMFGPMFMIATNHHFHKDGKITTTDGALVNIRDVVNEKLAPTGWAAVTGTSDESPVIPLIGAFVKVDSRFASQPQRLASVMETLTCTWPGCDIPAAKCQIHHMQAYKHGGPTTGVNLVPLCKEHNGQNDDNPGQHVNGRIERDPITGRPGLRRSPNQPLEFNHQLIAEKTIAAYVQQQLA
jgi:hypothetical protein